MGTDTSFGAIHKTLVPDSKKMDMPYVVATTAKWVRDLVYERVCPHGDKGVLQLLLDKVARECRPEGQDWRFCTSVTDRAIREMEQRRKPSPQYVDLLEHIWQFSKTKTRSFESDNTLSDASMILTRYNVRRDTRMTPYEKIRGQKYRQEILPLGEQVLSRRPGANVNQLLQPWVTGLWLGGDTLSDEHLIGAAAGVMRSRAVRRLQEPARCVNRTPLHSVFSRTFAHMSSLITCTAWLKVSHDVSS